MSSRVEGFAAPPHHTQVPMVRASIQAALVGVLAAALAEHTAIAVTAAAIYLLGRKSTIERLGGRGGRLYEARRGVKVLNALLLCIVCVHDRSVMRSTGMVQRRVK